MLYCEDYTEDNAATLQKRLNDVEDFELCYRDDPTDPVLVSKRKLFCNPFRYHAMPARPTCVPQRKTFLMQRSRQRKW
ncbi:hypothetical protein BCR43DRAFT_519450 [Syncephalastrum racemosum]|uniref:Uncharacterized protein n=1 Tax=Syncephalastrum racemosum TaxID=13706 RepID=A0A1X2GZ29_SYNRA|nr:hypothetical protein BCR43DRAFT_519450 [Syncephalastrum racemosum]